MQKIIIKSYSYDNIVFVIHFTNPKWLKIYWQNYHNMKIMPIFCGRWITYLLVAYYLWKVHCI